MCKIVFDQESIGLSLECDWLWGWRELSGPITKRSGTKPKQSTITFDSQLKFALFTDTVFKLPGFELLLWNISYPYSFKYVQRGSFVSTDFWNPGFTHSAFYDCSHCNQLIWRFLSWGKYKKVALSYVLTYYALIQMLSMLNNMHSSSKQDLNSCVNKIRAVVPGRVKF